MRKRRVGSLWMRTTRRQMATLTRSALRAGSKFAKQAMKVSVKTARKPAAPRSPPSDMVAGMAGARRYQLYCPPTQADKSPPLVVMLHGCAQDARSFAASTRMNRLAATSGFLVLYPEQDRLANAHGCWNWFETRSGQAQREAASILLAVEQVCARHGVDRGRVVVAGMSAGASMAALLALCYPARFAAVAMHSGVGPGLAYSSATALAAMQGRRSGVRGALVPSAIALPALLVIQGTGDPVVAPANGLVAARRWAAMAGATEGVARRVQNGTRHAANLTDWAAGRKVVATLASVQGLGHAWSGGPASQPYSDPAGPDASRMVWAFAKRVFARAVG